MELSPITIGMLGVAVLLVLFRVSLSTKGAKKVRRRGIGRRDGDTKLDLDD